MGNQFLIIGLSFLICLTAAAVLFSLLSKADALRERLLTAALSISGALFVGVVPLTCFFWYSADFVASISLWQYLLPLIAGLLIAASFFIRRPFAVGTAVFLASMLSVFGGGFSIEFLPESPAVVNRMLTAVGLWIFAYGWKAVSGLNPLPQSEGITICLGILLLYIFGLAPFILGITSAGLLAALLIAYLYSPRQPLGSESAPLLGFIVGWLGLICSGEYLLPCFLTFAMFYLLEFTLSLIRRLTLLPQYGELAYNSASVQAFSDGFPAAATIRVIWSTNILMIIFGLIQVNSGNVLSIPLFAAVIASWQMYRMINWRNASQTLKETNHELMDNIKTSVGKIFTPKSNDKPDKD